MCAKHTDTAETEEVVARHRDVASEVLPDHTDLYIGGEWVTGGASSLEAVDPTTGERLTEVSAADADDIDRAVKAAWEAYDGEWGSTTAEDRQDVLLEIADRVEANLEDLATLETLDNGKPLIESRADMRTVIDQFRYFAGIVQSDTGAVLSDDQRMGHTIREPYGVVGQIIPWNFPLSMASWKLAPALAAGNCCVLKPAEQTPLSILRLMELVDDVVPDGVVNVVPGDGREAGAALTQHSDVRKLAFTGSTAVGKEIMRNAADNVVDVTLELGGKSPVVVFPDADIDKAIDVVKFAIFANAGECCTAGSRLFVHDEIAEEFLNQFVETVEDLTVGDPLSEGTDIGPQISDSEVKKTLEYVETAIEGGGELMTGGSYPSGQAVSAGSFVEPTVIGNVPHDNPAVQEEIFGPVLETFTWTEYDEMMALVNDVDYGLSASVVTQDIDEAYQAARDIEAGYVWINQHHDVPSGLPFGGYKQSGIGRELAETTLEHYQQTKTINVGL
ncbi:aldehyde dehydrogenase family protein (plasmid) [Haloferax prahovense]|uniref:aldehyde dehydrogenase family protein n=1 Tax=Haloferax prahovense TaxID=381852 RepID=UPI003C73C0F2